MIDRLLDFWRDENGAITVDWVVLTAAIVGLGALMFFYLNERIQNTDESVGRALSGIEVGEVTFD